jgi:hypothetical protein
MIAWRFGMGMAIARYPNFAGASSVGFWTNGLAHLSWIIYRLAVVFLVASIRLSISARAWQILRWRTLGIRRNECSFLVLVQTIV